MKKISQAVGSGTMAKEEMDKKRTREEEKEENETVIVKRRCVNPVSTEAFDIFSQEEFSGSCGSLGDLLDYSCGLSDCDSVTWTSLLLVSDVFVWLRFVKVFPRILIGNLLNRSRFLSPKSARLFVRRIKER